MERINNLRPEIKHNIPEILKGDFPKGRPTALI